MTGAPLSAGTSVADAPPLLAYVALGEPAIQPQPPVQTAPVTETTPAAPTPPPPVVPTLPGTIVPPAVPATDDDASQDAIVVSGQAQATPGDPLEKVNAQSFDVTQKVDEAFVGPLALAYRDAVPRPLRRGLRNFLRNLREPVVFINYLLQLKPGKAAETVGRFAINTTLGVAGLFDAAKKRPFNLPYRPNGFANSMGYYGVKQGPFLYLPLLGSTTVRDLIGNTLDRLVLPLGVGKPFNNPYVTVPIVTLSVLDERAEFDDEIQALRKSNADPYATMRDYYLKAREAEIEALHGRVMPGMKPFTVAPIPPVPAPDAADADEAETPEASGAPAMPDDATVSPAPPPGNPPSP